MSHFSFLHRLRQQTGEGDREAVEGAFLTRRGNNLRQVLGIVTLRYKSLEAETASPRNTAPWSPAGTNSFPFRAPSNYARR
jgi:hypothetical protein